jgi:hypothetical protein
MKFTKTRLKQLIKEELQQILQESFAEQWATQYGLDVDYDNEGQRVIYLDNQQADELNFPVDPETGKKVMWDAQRAGGGWGWIIYTGEYNKDY